jgi:hypothetical protein
LREVAQLLHQFSSYIYFSEESRATLCDLPIYVGSVPTEHLDTFDTKLKASFERIVKEGIDMERMAMVINRDERQVRHTSPLGLMSIQPIILFASCVVD